MTAVELNARKAEMIRMIMNDVNNEVVVSELEQVIRRFAGAEPCCYTPEEIKTSAIEAIRQRKAGRYTAHEDMKRLIDNV